MTHPMAIATERAASTGAPSSHSPAGHAASHRDREAIAGTVVVAVLLAGGRWISHISVGPVYLSDILLGIAVVHAVTSRLVLGQRLGRTRGPGLLVGLVLLDALIRLLTSEGDDARTAARDAAPFAYLAIGYLSARSYLLANASNRRRTLRLLYGALVIHFGWVALALLAPGLASALPQLGNASVLEIRSDFDTAMLGVLSGWSILRFRRERAAWLSASLAGASLALALAMGSRAGLLSCCACVLAALLTRARADERTTARTAVLGAAAAVLLLALLPNSPAGQRLVATVDSSATSQQIAASAQGTAHARKVAWKDIVAYTLSDPARTMVGVGFGPDIMRLSGADLALGGRNIGVRSPHNYLLTSFARLGLIGLTLIATLLAVIFATAVRELRTPRLDELASLCVLLAIAMPVIAMLGVVLESPFGAIPFFWAGGILLASARRRRGQKKSAELPA